MFLHRQVSGNATIIARVAALQNIDGWSKAGVMIRESLAPASRYAFALATPANGIAFQYKTRFAGLTPLTGAGVGTAPVWLKLVRQWSRLTAFRSPDGTTWTMIGSVTVSMASTVYVGLAVTSRNPAQTATATFSGVSIGPVTNDPPAVSLTAPANGATYTVPASIPMAATATDANGPISRVDFYAGTTLIGTDWVSPYTFTWNGAVEGAYGITAVARDNAGAMTVSAARDIRVDAAALPRTAIFTASANHATAVDRYFLEIFPAGANPLVANPVATRDLGKPPVVSGTCTVDVGATTVALPPGSYIATVTAIGPAGSARSAASPVFVR